MEACLLKHVRDPHKENLQDAIRIRVQLYPRSVRKVSLGLMHFVNEMYGDVTEIKTVEVLGDLFDKPFIRHLMAGTGEASRRNELVHALQEN